VGDLKDLLEETREDLEETREDLLTCQNLGPVPLMPKEDLAQFVFDYCDGKILVSSAVPENLLTMVFLPLALGCFSGWESRHLQQIGVIWEYLSSRMGSRFVNGYPTFGSLRILHAQDWAQAKLAITHELARRKDAKASIFDDF